MDDESSVEQFWRLLEHYEGLTGPEREEAARRTEIAAATVWAEHAGVVRLLAHLPSYLTVAPGELVPGSGDYSLFRRGEGENAETFTTTDAVLYWGPDGERALFCRGEKWITAF